VIEVVAALVLLLALVLLVAALAPLESLGWWAGWFGDPSEIERRIASDPPSSVGSDVDYYVVYLSGIGSISGDELLPSEARFVADLQSRLPESRVISDVFPYSASGVALTAQHLFARFWRLLYGMRVRGGSVLVSLVNIRNLFQVLVSADERYGPIFNYGASRVIVDALFAAGFRPGSDASVYLLGSSGGAQIAVGSATYLQPTVRTRIEVVSLGGVMAAGPGLDVVDHVTHLYGSHDRVQLVAGRVFPHRWEHYPNGRWRRAELDGRVHRREIGPLEHNGTGGYMDADTVLEDGETCLERTLVAVVEAIAARERGRTTAE